MWGVWGIWIRTQFHQVLSLAQPVSLVASCVSRSHFPRYSLPQFGETQTHERHHRFSSEA